MILVTFHGGEPSPPNINNIYGYDETTVDSTTGQPAAYPNVLSTTDTTFTLSELRGIVLEQGILYVANGGKTVSNILGFSQVSGGTSPSFDTPALFLGKSPTINHPFAFTFVDSVTPNQWAWWVSNQDSNVVALVTAPAPTQTAPFSPANALTSGPAGTFLQTLLANLKEQKGTFSFLAGSFVASARVEAPLPQVTPVDKTWGGLDATVGHATSGIADKPKEKVKVLNSVRGVLFTNGILYVADEVGKFVRMYDPNTGIPWGSTSTSGGPVHLTVQNNTLYVSTSDGVYYGTCPSPPTKHLPTLPEPFKKHEEPVPPYPKDPPKGYNSSVTLTLTKLGLATTNTSPSGITFDSSGNLYVADRKGMAIYKYVPNTNGSTPPFVSPPGTTSSYITTPDQPEFLLWYPWQSS
jgi:Beta-propeller repeat